MGCECTNCTKAADSSAPETKSSLWKNGDMRLGNDGIEVYKDGKFERVNSSFESKVIKLLEEIRDRMPPKPEKVEIPVCGRAIVEEWGNCIRPAGHQGKCTKYE